MPHIDRKEGIAQHLLFWNVARSDPAAYLASYDRFAAWVDHSLEQYRVRSMLVVGDASRRCWFVSTQASSQPELARLLYPLLIYCYLDLVGKGATAQAHKMMTKAQRRFVEGQPQGKGRLQVQCYGGWGMHTHESVCVWRYIHWIHEACLTAGCAAALVVHDLGSVWLHQHIAVPTHKSRSHTHTHNSC